MYVVHNKFTLFTGQSDPESCKCCSTAFVHEAAWR